jgi:regulator of protease activity HflC (stomatin/prohibitin superfamily)
VNVQADVTVKFKVIDPVAATIKVLDHIQKTSEVSQAAFRNLLIQSARNELVPLDKVSKTLQWSIDKETRTWGVEVIEVELKKMTFT